MWNRIALILLPIILCVIGGRIALAAVTTQKVVVDESGCYVSGDCAGEYDSSLSDTPIPTKTTSILADSTNDFDMILIIQALSSNNVSLFVVVIIFVLIIMAFVSLKGECGRRKYRKV